MKKMGEKIKATKVTQHLDISVPTLTSWYGWYNNPDIKKPDGVPYLPPYEQAHERATRFWDADDLPALVKFRDWVPQGRAGVMGEHNARYWGKRGKQALANKTLEKE